MKRTTLVFVGIVCGLAGGWFVWQSFNTTEVSRIVSECEGATKKEACYEERISALFPERPLEEIFSLTRQVRHIDPGYQFCHVLGHKLGEAAVAEDPDSWLELMSKNPRDGLCSNGFIHGVIGGRFRAEVLDTKTLNAHISDFSKACEPRDSWRASPLDQAMCYHGMGHLYMFITDANVPQALQLCEKTAHDKGTGDYRQVCIEGVFMQIYQPLEPDDFLMIERMPVVPTKDTVRTFCATFPDPRHEGACLRESWPFFRQEVLSGMGVEEFCSGQPDAKEESACYATAFSLIGRMSLQRPSQALDACGALFYTRKPDCYSYAARAVLEESREDSEQAISLCMSVPKRYVEGCIQSLVAVADFIFSHDTEYKETFCNSVKKKTRFSCSSALSPYIDTPRGVIHSL